MKEDMTAFVLRHIPERVPRTKAELAESTLQSITRLKQTAKNRVRENVTMMKRQGTATAR